MVGTVVKVNALWGHPLTAAATSPLQLPHTTSANPHENLHVSLCVSLPVSLLVNLYENPPGNLHVNLHANLHGNQHENLLKNLHGNLQGSPHGNQLEVIARVVAGTPAVINPSTMWRMNGCQRATTSTQTILTTWAVVNAVENITTVETTRVGKASNSMRLIVVDHQPPTEEVQWLTIEQET